MINGSGSTVSRRKSNDGFHKIQVACESVKYCLLQLCGSEVSRCDVPHGRWDEPFTYPFLDLLGRHCPNLRQAVIIFMHADSDTPPETGDRGHIMQQLLGLPSLTDLTLIDPRSAQR